MFIAVAAFKPATGYPEDNATPPGCPTRGRAGNGGSEGRRLVELATAFGLPLPPLGAVAVAALAGPLHLGRGPLEGGADLSSLGLGD
jgi:hypothetical protein